MTIATPATNTPTTPTTTPTCLAPQPINTHYRFSHAVRSEFTKLRSLRSTTWTYVFLAVAAMVIGFLVTRADASNWASTGLVDRVGFDPTNESLNGLAFGQLAMGVLGVLVITAEFSTGTIQSTFSAVPNRPMVLAAKALVLGLVTLVVAEVVSIVTFLIGQATLSGKAPTASLTQMTVLRAVLFGGLYIVGMGLLALGLGAIIRNTAGAIAAFVSLVLVLPLVLGAFPENIRHDIVKYLPDRIGDSMASVLPGAAWTPWAALGMLTLYVSVVLIAGGVLLQRRDP